VIFSDLSRPDRAPRHHRSRALRDRAAYFDATSSPAFYVHRRGGFPRRFADTTPASRRSRESALLLVCQLRAILAMSKSAEADRAPQAMLVVNILPVSWDEVYNTAAFMARGPFHYIFQAQVPCYLPQSRQGKPGMRVRFWTSCLFSFGFVVSLQWRSRGCCWSAAPDRAKCCRELLYSERVGTRLAIDGPWDAGDRARRVTGPEDRSADVRDHCV